MRRHEPFPRGRMCRYASKHDELSGCTSDHCGSRPVTQTSTRGLDCRRSPTLKSWQLSVVVEPRSECSTGTGGTRYVTERQTQFDARRMAATREAVEA